MFHVTLNGLPRYGMLEFAGDANIPIVFLPLSNHEFDAAASGYSLTFLCCILMAFARHSQGYWQVWFMNSVLYKFLHR